MGHLFTHNSGDFAAISVTERSCAAHLISKEGSPIGFSGCAILVNQGSGFGIEKHAREVGCQKKTLGITGLKDPIGDPPKVGSYD